MKWLEHKNSEWFVFGHRVHHLDLGIILVFIGWILIVHDWYFYERKKS